ncbi:permease [Pseudoruegeria sp. HB172150]|uniref:permease n=1 Tax=Pseudoruegeria sp. HB172150 TaxID=2721164 RepID=UPI001C12EC5F|nr:permease [Pseudoruegeria sp. HB172150]
MKIAVRLFLPLLLIWLGIVAYRRGGMIALRQSGGFAVTSALNIAPRLIVALLAASFLSQIIPAELIGRQIGASSGLTGILIASILGGIMPGGPMTSFPIAVFLWGSGAGAPQIMALIAGWSVFAMHRVIAYELPMMGWRFTLLRMLAVAVIPPLTGLLAAEVVSLLGPDAFAPPAGRL